MAAAFLTVLPKLMAAAGAPAARQASISGRLAASKQAPLSASRAQDLRRRIGLHRIIDFRRRQSRAQRRIVVGDAVKIHHQAWRGQAGRVQK